MKPGDTVKYGNQPMRVLGVVPPYTSANRTALFQESLNDHWLGQPTRDYNEERAVESYLLSFVRNSPLRVIVVLPEGKKVVRERPILFWPHPRDVKGTK